LEHFKEVLILTGRTLFLLEVFFLEVILCLHRFSPFPTKNIARFSYGKKIRSRRGNCDRNFSTEIKYLRNDELKVVKKHILKLIE
jgi:hypothetical protein